MPHFFRTDELPPRERAWRVAYRGCAADGGVYHQNSVVVVAPTGAEAGKRAVLRAHDEDPSCDERIDYRIEVARVEEAGDDEQDDPRG